MTTLRYRNDLKPEELLVGECLIARRGVHWYLSFRFKRVTDGKPETRSVPVVIGGPAGPAEDKAWALVRAEGGWQVSPSIHCLDSRWDPVEQKPGAYVSVWHETPLVVGVPEGEPWQ